MAKNLLLELYLAQKPPDELLKVVTKTRPRRLAAATLRGNASDAAWQSATQVVTSVYTRIAEVLTPSERVASLARPVTRNLLMQAIAEAEQASLASARAAWNAGARQAQAASVAIGSPLTELPSSQDFLPSIQADIRRNATSALNALDRAAGSWTEPADVKRAVEAVMKELTRRARLSVTVTYSRAYNAAFEAAAVENGQKLLWVSALHANTCATCAALHGTVINPGQEFAAEVTLKGRPPKTYGGLPYPPRHPGCYCQAVPFSSSTGRDIKSMQNTARELYLS